MPLPERQWEFTELSPKIDLTTSAFFKVLPSSGLSEEEILVRESIQNSRDATKSGHKAKITFRGLSIDREKREQLVDALMLESVISERAEYISAVAKNQFLAQLKGEAKLDILEISDEGTTGLGGNWKGRTAADHFARLVMRIGESEKNDNQTSRGGSFGFGKTVFAKSSSVHLVLYYSVSEKPCTEGHEARFMAVWLLGYHTINGIEYSGFSFLGRRIGQGACVGPIINSDAHAMAEACGLSRRSDNQHGTTVGIISCNLDFEKIKDAVEIYWWPALTDKTLSVAIDYNGSQMVVSPKTNPKVTPYLDLASALCDNNLNTKWKADPERPEVKAKRFASIEGLNVGAIAMKVLSDQEKESWKQIIPKDTEGLVGESKMGGIALVRGTGMVITYQNQGESQADVTVGLYKAHDEVDGILRISEPPAHHIWDEQESRLRMAYPESPEKAPKIVKRINRYLLSSANEFRRNQPPPPPPTAYRLKTLESLISKFVSSGKDQMPVPQGPERPISISLNSARTTRDSTQIDVANISVSVRSDLQIESLKCLCKVEYHILGNTTGNRVDTRHCDLFTESGDGIAVDSQGEFEICLTGAEPLKIRAEAPALKNSKAEFKVYIKKQKT